jgi:3-hydroxyacyl-CoA dehydrogenase
MEHQPPEKVRFESIGKVKDEPDLGKRLSGLIAADDRAGQLVKAFTYQALSYASERIPEIADTPKPIDDAMRWGFGHQAGPFEIWDMLGVPETVAAMKAAGFPPAAWVEEMLASGKESFYQSENGRVKAVYNPVAAAYDAIHPSPAILVLSELKPAGGLIKRNPGASLVDLGDGVICVEFNTKMNTFDDDIHNMVIEALDMLDRDYEGLVIGNDADNFSAGANLFMIVMGAQNEIWDQIEAGIRKGQDMHMRMRYSPKPVVVAPAGLALAGGAEMTMHASRIVAAAELYTGLVEFGVGVIPAWGGTKEIMRRVLNPAMRTKNATDIPYLQRAFEQIGLAKVATSAEEARQMGILGPCDRVIMNRDHLLGEAKREVLNMVAQGYTPPIPEKIYAAGREGLAALKVAVYMLKEGGYASEHDALVAGKLAYVLTGGELSTPSWVSEQYILDLERETFLSLAGEKKSQERMWHTLQTGKPLRN